MYVKIDGKNYELHFGVRFVRELDKKYSIEGPVEFGTGVNNIYARLQSPNPYALYEALHAALQPDLDLTEKEFDIWVDSFKSEQEYTRFFGLFTKELKNHRQTRPLVKNYEKVMNEVKKQFEKEKNLKAQDTMKP